MQLVVIADDDALSRSALSHTLARAAFAVSECSSGDEVLSTLRRRIPALLILDLLLPGVDGYSLLAEIKGDPVLRSIPVVLTSGEPAEVHEPVGRSLGAAAFLPKPFDAQAVRRVVDHVLAPTTPTP